MTDATFTTGSTVCLTGNTYTLFDVEIFVAGRDFTVKFEGLNEDQLNAFLTYQQNFGEFLAAMLRRSEND